MKTGPARRLVMAIALIAPVLSNAGEPMVELSVSRQSDWRFISDQVMGGVSQGRVTFEQADGQPVLRLSGEVSTANRGGFIQARTELDAPLPADAEGVILTARGNGQTYFVHLRTTGTLLPWQYYQAPFVVSETWQELRIPFDAFVPSGALLRARPDAGSIRSIAVVAFGRDHSADLSVRTIGFY